MKEAQAAIAAWVAAGNLDALLVIRSDGTTLLQLPVNVRKLVLYSCPHLRIVGDLPPTELRQLVSAAYIGGRLEDIVHNCRRLPPAALPNLPATLTSLFCNMHTVLPDTPPLALRRLDDFDVEETRVVWLWRVSRQHRRDRRRVVAHLPCAAALYV